MYKVSLLLFFLLFSASHLLSQDVVLEMDVEDQYQKEKGPNTRHYSQVYIGFGSMTDFDESEGTAINPLRSSHFVVGYRYKLKVLSFWSLGLDLGFKTDAFFLEGDDVNPYNAGNPLTYSIGEKKHYFTNNGLGLEVFQRINVGSRGNSLGNYLDFGIRGQWNVADVQEIITNYDNSSYVRRTRIINRRLQYVEEFSYGLSARIGHNRFAIHGYYRLSDLFRENYLIPELPRLVLGFQIALK